MTTKDFQTKRPLAIFLSYFRPHRRLFALDIICAFMISLVDLAFPLISRTAMYQWLPQQQYRTFFIVMGIVVLAFVLRSFLCFVVGYWGHTFGIRVEADIRRDLFRHMQELGFDFYDRNRTGQLMSRLTSDLFEVTELAHHGPEDLFISAVTIVGALIVMFSIQWRLALVVSLIIPIFMVVVMYRRRQMSAASRAAKQKTGVINAEIESGLSGVRTTKAFANEEKQQTRFDGANEIFKTAKRGFHKEMGLFNASMEFFICILSVAVIAVGGWLIMKGQMDYVGLITFSLYITTFISPIRKLANFAEMFSNGFAGLHRFIELMATEPTIQDAPDAVELSQVRGEVELDHVSFTYPGSSEVLHDISLTVAAGETVAIVGPSGGGKSTLCQLVPRFYDVTEGSIRVDGLDVRQVTQRSLRRAIGIVQQDVFLFADTIRENIRYGRPDATDEEVEQAAHRAELLEDIRAMPQGFDTYVGERGAMLSGGQKQRVAIARIFLKDPAILILDEATSALDSVTEAKIQGAFDQLSRAAPPSSLPTGSPPSAPPTGFWWCRTAALPSRAAMPSCWRRTGPTPGCTTRRIWGRTMDKRDLLDRLAANGDERLLLGRVWDKYEQCRRRNIPVVTGFLSPAEQELVRRLMGALDVREGWLLWGGYDTAQRRQAHFLPDWQTEPDFEAVAALRATFYEPNSLTHRDVLGSLMGLGVTRESVGDILVAEQSVDVLVTEPVRRFLLDSWDSAGRVRLKVQPIGPTELQVPEEKVKLLRDTVSSLRLDSVLSVGFSLSRSKAAEAVTSGKVQVNWADWQKPDRQVVQGDVLTLRGLGKCVLEEVGNQTKKGRVFITVKRYL